jgi:hypothetical protein
VSDKRTPDAPAKQETEAQRLARLDREAMQTYSARRFGGGTMSRRYHLHRNDEPDPPTAKPNKKR